MYGLLYYVLAVATTLPIVLLKSNESPENILASVHPNPFTQKVVVFSYLVFLTEFLLMKSSLHSSSLSCK